MFDLRPGERVVPPPQSQWRTPPRGALPVGVGLSVVLMWRPPIGVGVAGFRVWPSGVEFVVTLQLGTADIALRQPPIPEGAPRPPTGTVTDPRLNQFRRLVSRPTLTPRQFAELPRAVVVTAGFADGGEGTTADWWRPLDDDQRPKTPIFGVRSQITRERTHEFTLYLAPLPPAGPLSLGFSWPGAGISPVHATVDATLIRAAGA